ncbi:hypothetical protein RJ639_030429 [Escallonia herrerae]|uniref:GAGA-binding transcriptional activator n=1 Tax=Escallonia herrerae TaxID=1293975 RepID=A0AA89BID7_9ASTE|nr:hypothetical protein RJ639_030429 [Escallonia herrerae]
MSEENNREACLPHFSWIPPGNCVPAIKISLNSFQATQMNPQPGFAAIPIRSVAPTAEQAKREKSSKSSKQSFPKVLTSKKTKKSSSTSKKAKAQTKPGANIERKNPNVVFNEANLDVSGVPPPFCGCTGVARGCYKWGSGGWQSSCCNSRISEYPLPVSSSKPGARIAGRKMSNGAYAKLLCRLAAEGLDLSRPVDLKDHWAKHGTNKFVTIK